MMRWVIISENYLSYLRSVEPHIPNSEYGKYKFKPFFGVLFETDDFC
ncbi:MAG: type III toxin-antitoxin system ToxN/AbiQ family toxin [Lachnospiraceae bacterium]|nr:type III toxin-antitoxin system ToxN/AbiQ family toxin [Lachnospiraceae bacterium]